MALEGTANRLSRNMAYNLFKSVVDYNDHYRGMQSVVLNGMEAYADIILSPDGHGTWHTPPHWIDSIFHLGGFVLNGSDVSNTKDYFYVTPGWGSSRIAKPLVAGGRYRSYVRMDSIAENNMYAGDVYVLQDGVIVAMLTEMKFCRVPRVLMNQAAVPTSVVVQEAPAFASQPKAVVAPAVSIVESIPAPKAPEPDDPAPKKEVAPAISDSPLVTDCLKILARESGLDMSELVDSATFVELGVDSLMSLVLSEKFKAELGIEVKSSVFIECPNIGELKGWLD